MENIEVELRGALTKEQYSKVHAHLSEHGTFVESRRRIILDYSTFLPEEGISGRTRDIRLRVTNGQPEIITKIGRWGGSDARRELSIKTEPGSFDALVETYAVLGYTRAVLCVRNVEVFTISGIECALVDVPGHSYYFEAEKVVAHQEEAEAAHAEITAMCEGLGLELFSHEDFFAYIDRLNREANEDFDYATYTPGYFAERFGL